ncbi:hypothetical protein L5515_010843 [Caenorhabditis briggsae]|uniref:C2H2-type domain-containing protein n=2 Tax=Caenorhabditis briggsae TaxID=6238 RepID=A0AAE9JDP1_CAEBR|nr:hypothetical protein L5515_010843 [Caenorhabditis briggsae]
MWYAKYREAVASSTRIEQDNEYTAYTAPVKRPRIHHRVDSLISQEPNFFSTTPSSFRNENALNALNVVEQFVKAMTASCSSEGVNVSENRIQEQPVCGPQASPVEKVTNHAPWDAPVLRPSQDVPETPEPNQSLRQYIKRNSKRPQGKKEQPAACQLCGMIIKHVSDRRRHVLFHLKLKPWKCTSCMSGFTRASTAILHFSKQHPFETSNPFVYELSNEETERVNKKKMEYFLESDESADPPETKVTDDVFSEVSEHNESEISIKDGEISIEDTESISSSPDENDPDLPEASEVNDDSKAYGNHGNTCKLCGKEYAGVADQKVHVMTHLHIKPWKCPICIKAYTRIKTVNGHFVQVHKGEPFQPPVTNLSIRDKELIDRKRLEYFPKIIKLYEDVSKPKTIFIPLKRVTCQECNREVSNVHADRWRHSFCHVGLKPFKCPHCNKCYTRADKAGQHSIKFHPNCEFKPIEYTISKDEELQLELKMLENFPESSLWRKTEITEENDSTESDINDTT